MRVSQGKKIEIAKINRILKNNINLMAPTGGYYPLLNKNNRGYLISVGTFTHHGKKLEGAHYGYDNSLSKVGINIEDT